MLLTCSPLTCLFPKTLFLCAGGQGMPWKREDLSCTWSKLNVFEVKVYPTLLGGGSEGLIIIFIRIGLVAELNRYV